MESIPWRSFVRSSKPRNFRETGAASSALDSRWPDDNRKTYCSVRIRAVVKDNLGHLGRDTKRRSPFFVVGYRRYTGLSREHDNGDREEIERNDRAYPGKAT